MITDGAFENESKTTLINHVICEHFLRQGMLDIAESLIEVPLLFLSLNKSMAVVQLRKEPIFTGLSFLSTLKAKHSKLEVYVVNPFRSKSFITSCIF